VTHWHKWIFCVKCVSKVCQRCVKCVSNVCEKVCQKVCQTRVKRVWTIYKPLIKGDCSIYLFWLCYTIRQPEKRTEDSTRWDKPIEMHPKTISDCVFFKCVMDVTHLETSMTHSGQTLPRLTTWLCLTFSNVSICDVCHPKMPRLTTWLSLLWKSKECRVKNKLIYKFTNL
jgi:hypothetical protein